MGSQEAKLKQGCVIHELHVTRYKLYYRQSQQQRHRNLQNTEHTDANSQSEIVITNTHLEQPTKRKIAMYMTFPVLCHDIIRI